MMGGGALLLLNSGVVRPENRQEAEICLAFFLQTLLIGPGRPPSQVPDLEPSAGREGRRSADWGCVGSEFHAVWL